MRDNLKILGKAHDELDHTREQALWQANVATESRRRVTLRPFRQHTVRLLILQHAVDHELQRMREIRQGFAGCG